MSKTEDKIRPSAPTDKLGSNEQKEPSSQERKALLILTRKTGTVFPCSGKTEEKDWEEKKRREEMTQPKLFIP